MNVEVDAKALLTKAILLNAHGLKRFAMSLCKNNTEAEELLAETVVKAFEHFHSLKDREKIKQWLFRILNNTFISACRTKRKYIEVELSAENNDDAGTGFSLFEEIASSSFVATGNPEKIFISKLTKEKIMEAVSSLPEEFRVAVMLCDVEEFSYAEIAQITFVVIGTVRSRIARARTILQEKLWIYAQELGICKSVNPKAKEKHVCTCGKEEIKESSLITE